MRHVPKTLWLALGLCLLALPLAADDSQSPKPKPAIAQVGIAPAQVEWLPLAADSKGLVLTVAGPEGFYLQRELRDGETASFSALDFKDNQLTDGVYTYELRAEGASVQSGSLWVRGGQFVAPAAQPKPPIRNVTAQYVLPEDLVVQGQACVGADCLSTDVNGPALKIKETDNYQIRFDALGCCVPWEQPWILQANEPSVSGDFLIRTPGTIPFRIMAPAPDNSFVIYPNGFIGLGTLTPAGKLHVLSTTGSFTQTALIEESNATTALRTLVQLRNNGDIRLNYTNTATGVTWGNNVIGGNYKMIKAGAGVTAFDLQGNGNLTIAGTLTQNSDRFTKHNIVPVQPEQILGKVLDLPIATWVRNGDEARHLGPMAQDFAAAFGLGEDDRHIATIDMAGVSLVSIQALNGRLTTALAAKDSEIETLRRESSDLSRRLAAMEKLVASLMDAGTSQVQPAP